MNSPTTTTNQRNIPPEGLHSPVIMRQFVQDLQAIFKNWGGSLAERLERIKVAINRALRAAGIPEISEIRVKALSGNTKGEFHSRDWVMTIDANLLNKNPPDLQDFIGRTLPQGNVAGEKIQRGLINTLYHEMGHAQHYYRAAQMLAHGNGFKWNAYLIHASLPVPDRVAIQAIATPLLPSQQAEAKEVHQSLTSVDAQGKRNMHRIGAALSASNPQTDLPKYRENYWRYRNQAHESRAFELGDRAQAMAQQVMRPKFSTSQTSENISRAWAILNEITPVPTLNTLDPIQNEATEVSTMENLDPIQKQAQNTPAR
jgi:hypothetical protein